MTTKQGRGVTQAVAFDAATVGGAWVGVWGEYRRARGSLHVRGAFWLRSQVPIRRAKGHSFTHNEDICEIYMYSYPTGESLDGLITHNNIYIL
eukprot:COSAG01_NODE_2707_length_7219_cov_7.643399_2_plen_93_part_00